MAKLKILIQGYAKEKDGFEHASSSTVLIQENNLNVIVDPGMNREKLLESLQNENLTVGDIDYVILTHFHSDHCLLAGIFENAKVMDDNSFNGWDSKIEEHSGKIPGTDIKLIPTPGHDYFHSSVLVDDDKLGKIVISGDIFWWGDDEEQKTDKEDLLSHEDVYVKDKERLLESRKKVLAVADYIIPGHGKMFKVKK